MVVNIMGKSAFFYPKLAIDNLKKNSKIYIPYILTGVVSATLYYILRSLSLNPGVRDSYGGSSLHAMLQMGADLSAVFIVIFLFYTNGFLMKHRQKEFAVLNILGMEKRHIIKTLVFETLYVLFLSILGGFLLGLALDKLYYLILVKALNLDLQSGFFISPIPFVHVIVLFTITNILIVLKSIWTMHILNPSELLRESKAGEKEPKVKWLLSILGILTLGIGYAIALKSENPVTAISDFFVAATLVIIATFLLFTTGSIALLKLLRKNRKFYYKTNHFISVSGLTYRMKQNAKGLASICILSTMVLVMLTSTGSLMLGLEDMVKERYPKDFNIEIYGETKEREEELVKKIQTLIQDESISTEKELVYHHLEVPVAFEGYKFGVGMTAKNACILFFLPLSEYNQCTGKNETLNDHELLVHTKRLPYNSNVMEIFEEPFSIKKQVEEFPGNGAINANVIDTIYCVCTDEQFSFINDMQKKAYGERASQVDCYIGFDTDATKEEQEELLWTTYDLKKTYHLDVENRDHERSDFMGLFGGMFFIGIFLGLLFTMATVLIIYYKQLSEGYEDRERFGILQKVGMSQKEVKKAIRSQILIVFFLPLLFAGMHLMVAFPILKKLLAAIGLVKTPIFIVVTCISYFIFAVLYVLVYSFTAKTYYKIVRR